LKSNGCLQRTDREYAPLYSSKNVRCTASGATIPNLSTTNPVSNGTKSNAGAPVIDLDGAVLGISLMSDINSFVSISTITDALKPATDVKAQ